MSIICDTNLAVSRPDARPVTWIGVLLELVETEEVDIATLVIGSRGDPRYGVQTPYTAPRRGGCDFTHLGGCGVTPPGPTMALVSLGTKERA
jgi:hypothetical protein